jgi:hypothetical protein
MHLFLLPALASVIWIGGGTGLIIVIVVLLLVLR